MRHSLATGLVALVLGLTAGCAQSPGTRPDVESPSVQAAPQAPTRPPVQAPPTAALPPVQATSPPAARPPAQAASQPAAPKPAPLDLSSLEQRLRATNAIGALTKIALKNQVDDLLEQFRTYYRGKAGTDLPQLRRSYDLLVMKFLALLQDEDKPLANAIVASREEIWGLLSDRTRFATL